MVGFDLAILTMHALEPSEFLGIINVKQYWTSRKLFEVLYEAPVQLTLQAIIFGNTPVSSRANVGIYLVSFATSAGG